MAVQLNEDEKNVLFERIRTDSSRILVIGDDQYMTVAFKSSFAYKGTNTKTTSAKFEINAPPLVLVKSLQAFFDASFSYGDQNINNVVDDIYKKGFDPKNYALSPEQLEVAKARKAYSRHYYGMLQLIMSEPRIASKENRDKFAIVMKIVTYIYVRRLMHVFIVSNIFVHMFDVRATTSSAPVAAAPFSSFASTTSSSRETDLNNKIQDLGKQLTVLESDRNAKVGEKQGEIDALKASLEALSNAVKEKDDRIKMLETNLAQYKELILESTNLIFNIEEANMRSMSTV